FRVPYCEPSFLVAAFLALYRMHRRRALPWIALVVRLATAVRPVGIALAGVLAVYLWQESSDWRQFLRRSLSWLPVSCWGLAAYMVYLHVHFGDPLAFASAHRSWVHRPAPWPEQIGPLLTLEPIWSPYLPSSATYWRNFEPPDNPLLNFGFMNSLFFMATVALIATGAVKRWLNLRETVLSAAL